LTSELATDGLVVEDVSKQFRGPDGMVSVIQEIAFRVERGGFVAIVGPSGSGKSTLLRMLAGLMSVETGHVTVFGETVREARTNKHIGYVPQAPALLPWRNVTDNVMLPFQLNRKAMRNQDESREVKESRAAALIAAVGLSGVEHRLPSELSGGMQQRVAIARALVFEPKVLFMDEPFSALDELTREQLRHELLRLFDLQRPTVVFVTHSITEAVLLADRVLVMSSGPGRLMGEVEVALPRPRAELVETTPEFHELENDVRAMMRSGWGPQ
jgi:NitT/TauT family transport system ATP-binding protein